MERMFVIGFWVCLFTLLVGGSSSRYGGITLIEFCRCWNAGITRTGNNLIVDITFTKTCWELPSHDNDGFHIKYDSSMLFKIGISESLRKLLKVQELNCKLNEGCSTTIKMIRDTSLEIVPICKYCDSCMGKETGYITYKNDNKIHPPEVVIVKPKDPPVEKPHRPLLLIMAGVVTVVSFLAFFIICKILYQKYRNRTGERDHREQWLLESSDGGTGVSIQISEPRSTESSPSQTDIERLQIRQRSVNIGVFYPHFPKELSFNSVESPLDTCVHRMIELLTSVQELNVKCLKLNFSNFCDEIDIITSSPKIIIVLCDRLNELIQEKCGQSENMTEVTWRNIENALLKRIRDRYYAGSNISLYFVNFKDVQQQNNVLTEVREVFTSQSYRTYSIGSLDEMDDHLKELLDSILFDVISNTEERKRRIDMILRA